MHRLSRRHLARTVLVLLALAFAGTSCEELPAGDDGGRSVETRPADTGSTLTTGPWGGEVVDGVGSAGLGDEYYPQAGNGGYDVLHYQITLDCDPRTGGLSGTTAIEAKALQGLEHFNLDLIGLEVESIEVDGVPADFHRAGQELTIECPEAIASGRDFSATVSYSGTPVPLMSAQGYPEGWQRVGNTVFTLDEPEGAATWYPLNDHPSDKATYSFSITVPESYVAAASGVLVDTAESGQKRTFTWEMRQPMANYLASVAIGEFTVEQTVAPNGVPIRNYFDFELAEEAQEAVSRAGDMLTYFAEKLGPYPFEAYGVVAVDADIGGAMENQSLTLIGRDALDASTTPSIVMEMILAHELAHQWLGNSVTPGEWQDIWLNEGFSTYASWLWFEHDLGPTGLDQWVEYALESLRTEESTPPGDPGVEELFGTGVYNRGGLTLHALRLTVGDGLFFDILLEWVSRYAYGNATTDDFVALVQEKAGHLPGFDSEGFFESWLYADTMPELPDD